MSSSFRRAAYSQLSISKTSTKIRFLSKVTVVLPTCNLLVIILPNTCWLLVNNFEQEQWLVPFGEHTVQSTPMASLEPSHTSKMELLRKKVNGFKYFREKAPSWMYNQVLNMSSSIRESLRKCVSLMVYFFFQSSSFKGWKFYINLLV